MEELKQRSHQKVGKKVKSEITASARTGELWGVRHVITQRGQRGLGFSFLLALFISLQKLAPSPVGIRHHKL